MNNPLQPSPTATPTLSRASIYPVDHNDPNGLDGDDIYRNGDHTRDSDSDSDYVENQASGTLRVDLEDDEDYHPPEYDDEVENNSEHGIDNEGDAPQGLSPVPCTDNLTVTLLLN
jgi:hypothetical protein